MKLIKTESIVLKNNLIGEKDKIVTLFTKTNGKIQAVANGARNSKSRLLGAVHPFTIAHYVLFEGQNYYYINEWEQIHSFLKISNDIIKISYASYFADLIYKLMDYGEKNINIYMLLKNALILLESDKTNDEILSIAYALRFSSYMGYMPEVNLCVSCGTKENLHHFSPILGGTLCEKCNSKTKDSFEINKNILLLMKLCLSKNIKNIVSYKVPNIILQDLDKIVTEYIKVQFDRSFKTKLLLDKIKFNRGG